MLNPKKIVFYRIAYRSRIAKVVERVMQIGKLKGVPPDDTRSEPTWTTALLAAVEAEFGEQTVYALPHVMYELGRWCGHAERRGPAEGPADSQWP